MFEKRVLTTGEKVKKLRKEIGVTQKDIVGNELTRSTISLIESDKIKLTKSVAFIISKNINNIINQKKLKFELITPEFLLENQSKQLEKIANKFIEEILENKIKTIDLFLNTINDVNKIAFKFPALKQIEIYLLIAEILKDEFMNYEESIYYIKKCFDIANRIKNFDKVLYCTYLMTNMNLLIGENKEVISTGKYAINFYNENSLINDDILKRIIYNTALACRKLGRNEECIEHLNMLKVGFDLNIHQQIDIENITGKSLFYLKRYNEAENTLLNALRLAKIKGNSNEVIKIIENLSLLYIDNNKLDEALQLANILEESKEMNINYNIESNIQKMYLAINFYYLTIIEIKLNRLEYVEKRYDAVLELAEVTNNELMQYNLLNQISKYFIEIKNTCGLSIIADKIYRKALKNLILSKNVINVLVQIQEYFEFKDQHMRKKVSEYCYTLRSIFDDSVIYDI